MMGLFRNMTFPRGVILVSLVSSAVLGYFVWARGSRLDEIHQELRQVKTVCREIQELGVELDQLQRAKKREGLTEYQNDPETYIRSIGAHERVGIGQLDTTPSVKTPMRGVEDRIYRIRPANKTQRYSRSQIGNFLYQLEAESRRVRVTSLKLLPFKKLKAGEIGDDVWTFEAAITSRSQVES